MSKKRRNGKSCNTKSAKGKMVEVDVARDDINKADLKNDASWYAANPQMLIDSASFSFNTPLGNKIDLEIPNVEGGIANTVAGSSIPGVLAMYVVPTVGIATDEYSPVNIASRNIYSFVRHANSGHANYDAPDLMLYLLAMDSLYSFHAFMVRAYGVLMTYSQLNRYLPKALVESMNLDFDDLQVNIADFRYYINNFAVKVGSLCTPNTMSYFIRHSWMYSNVYMDSPNLKGQCYIYTPSVFYQFEPVASTQGGSLVPKYIFNDQTVSTKLKYKDIVNFGNSLINAVMADEDMNIMSGDILKAFGESGILKLAMIDEAYQVIPMYNAEVLNQINNATVMPQFVSVPAITQSTLNGAILWSLPSLAGENDFTLAGRRILNSYLDSPTPADVMVGTRLMTAGSYSSEGTVIDAVGSEFIICARIAAFVEGTNGWTLAFTPRNQIAYSKALLNTTSSAPTAAQYNATYTDFLNEVSMQKFDWAPICVRIAYSGASGARTYNFIGATGDLMNYTTIGRADLLKLHETALLSEFAVPQMGRM